MDDLPQSSIPGTLNFTIKRCPAGLCGNAGEFIEPTVLPDGIRPSWRSELLREIEMEAPPRDASVAAHEAGHAVLFHGLGVPIKFARIDLPALVSGGVRDVPTSPAERVVISLAGPVAELWDRRAVYRDYDAALAPYARAVKALEMGGCDRCQAMMNVARIVGIDATDAAYFEKYRALEARTIALIQRPDVWGAIRELAAELMRDGVVDGARAHEIIERHLSFGSIKIEE